MPTKIPKANAKIKIAHITEQENTAYKIAPAVRAIARASKASAKSQYIM
jgi:hypothetical protein